MRTFVKQSGWLLAAVAVLGLLCLALAVGIILDPHSATTPSSHPLTPATRLDAYRGIATWVDVFDAKAWRDPAAAVRDMADHGVRTIFIETATAKSTTAILNPSAMSTFITEAHARNMYIVAWYPPNMRKDSVDFERAIQAIEFATDDGQRFDSVALDIESTVVKPIGLRNRNVIDLSQRIRSRVGTDYPLGAIIPSPVGLTKQTGFWNVFPYTELAKTYDIFLPMSYYTYHTHTTAGAYADTDASMRILRAQPGCETIPVHIIGGLAGDTSAAQVQQFARAAGETDCIGVSLYDWVGMNNAKWRELRAGWAAGSR
jgi:hypothetical protein